MNIKESWEIFLKVRAKYEQENQRMEIFKFDEAVLVEHMNEGRRRRN